MLSSTDFKAPKGKFRVVGVDTFDGTDWIEGDFATDKEAFSVAKSKGGTMLKTHVYNDKGIHIYEGGSV